MQKTFWKPENETTERLLAIRDGNDAGMRSHHARILADKELVRRHSA